MGRSTRPSIFSQRLDTSFHPPKTRTYPPTTDFGVWFASFLYCAAPIIAFFSPCPSWLSLTTERTQRIHRGHKENEQFVTWYGVAKCPPFRQEMSSKNEGFYCLSIYINFAPAGQCNQPGARQPPECCPGCLTLIPVGEPLSNRRDQPNRVPEWQAS